ncbi:Na/Pi cotransporter family protein [Frisingicoccus sp.]|uniref:Na/Pi cotransporter family protein n=1 Tax=Frisingicoccus sp. TaxID=1918627 RepID=UPI002EBD0683|nr:Na/Pi cotransporter family protein [Frisingicoccus sp.]
MQLTDFFGLLGGLALFLYGMQMMSDGLEDAAGNRMKQILEKLTATPLLGVAVGAGITAVIQSSSATTVMVVGFVNSGMMTLQQAVWIIMGANIGTTITGQLIALDVGMIAPLFAFLGVAMIVLLKLPKAHYIGKILAGLGILFIGMDMMGAAMVPFQESKSFISLMTKFSNPVLGILAGALFTAIIQSSSASVGILQTLATNGLIPFSSAVFVLFGQNIGTCITAVLAAIGTNRSAKRTTLIHLMFNIIGTCVFTILCLTLPMADFIGGFTPDNPAAQIANMHTIFNIVTTAILLPFGTFLAALATKILPDSRRNENEEPSLLSLTENYTVGRTSLGHSAIHTDLLHQRVEHMLKLAQNNIEQSFQMVLDTDLSPMKQVSETEDMIDALNIEISQFISRILVDNNIREDIASIEEYFLITGNAERLGDHASNISEYVPVMRNKSITFSETAHEEIQKMKDITNKVLNKILNRDTKDMTNWLSEIAAMEQQMDSMTETYRDNHLNRMCQGECSEEACILFSELLTDFERIGDHALNIAQSYAKISIMQ